MPSFATSLIDQVKQSVDMVSVAGESVALHRAGRVYKGLCPFHDDHNPSFTVDPDRQTFKCWSCGKGGDVISFVQERDRLPFREALHLLAERAGIPVSRDARSPDTDQRTQQYSVLQWAADEFHRCLLQSPAAEPARRYLEERSISSASIQQFQLGFHPSGRGWLIERGRAKSWSPAILHQAGLLTQRDQDQSWGERFFGRVMFPIRDTRGRTVAFGGRILPSVTSPDAAKYLNSPETALFKKSEMLYGFDRARKSIADSGAAVVVEGYTDCILAHQFGITNVVAPLGTALTDRHAQFLRRHVKQVVVVFDGDAPGQRAAERAMEIFLAHDLDVCLCTLPKGQDPCDFLVNQGPEPFRKLLASADEALDFYLGRLLTQYDANTTHGRYEILQAVSGLLTQVPRTASGFDVARRVREDLIFGKLAHRLGVPEATIRAHVAAQRRPVQRRRPAEPAAQEAPAPPAAIDALEMELLEILLAEPALLTELAREVPLESIQSDRVRNLIERCEALAVQGVKPSFSHLMAQLEDLEVKRLVIDAEAAGRHKGDVAQRYQQVIRSFHRRRELQRSREIQQQLRQAAGDPERTEALLQQLKQSRRSQQHLV